MYKFTINPSDSLFENTYKIYDYVQLSNVQLSGVEMNIHYHPHRFHNLHFEQSYTFLNTNNSDNNFGLALTPANNVKTKLIAYFEKGDKMMKYKINSISVDHLYSLQQNNHAQYESPTNSYSVINVQLYFKFNNKFKMVFGLNNILNTEYSPHTSRLRLVAGGVPNPGRSFNVNLNYEF